MDGSSTTTSYNGAIVTVADQANHQKAYGFDGIGRLAWVEEDPGGLGYMANYIRDGLDNITQVNQGDCSVGCQQRFFTFDSFSRLKTASNPESGLTSYEYDLAGNLTKKTDARGVATSLSYDALNRLTGKTYSTGMPSTLYVYDDSAISNSIGQLTKAASAYGVTNYTGFDAMGRVLGSNQLIGPSTFSFNYTYDLAGDLLSETYPTGRIISNRYDGAGRVANVTGSLNGQGTTYANVYSYWPHGAPYYFGYGNNVVPVYVYNNRLQLYGAWASINNDPNRFLETWALNWGGNTNNGNLLATGEYYGNAVPQGQMSSFSQNYGYDSVNRLTSASDNGGWSRNFAYDKTGNGWMTANNGVPLMGNTPTSNVYDNGNHLAGQSYDAAGNQASVNGDSLTYDAENRLTLATEPVYLGGGTETFVYDGLGQRTEKSSPSQTFVYVYDAFGALAVKYAPWNTVLQEYVRMSGQLIATENSGASPCQTCYFVWDHLGNTRLVTDQNANVVARHDYLPFGEEVPGGWAGRSSEWGASDNIDQKFTGQQRDSETGLDYFHARYLSSALGRFASPDPDPNSMDLTNPQSFNRYSYVWNNPLANTDPTGADCTKDNGDGCVILAPDDTGWFDICWFCNYDFSFIANFSVTVTRIEKVPTSRSSAKTGTCPTVPVHPGNYPPQALYNFGINASKSLSDNLNPDLAKTLAYGALVAPNQPFDFKNQPSPGANPQYRAYGNFAFGVFGSSLGFSSTYIKWGAGVASYGNMLLHLKLPPLKWGTPVTGSPYGDNPLEQQEIQAGYQWAQMYAAGKCK